MSELRIREATAADVAEIQDIAKRGWNTAYDTILSQDTIDAAMNEWYDTETIRELIGDEGVGYFVAERNGTVVGYASGGIKKEAGVASLGAIYVDPDCWNEGIGHALLERFERFCRNHDSDSIRLQVLSENDIGRGFYTKNGYEMVAERETELFGETVTESAFRSKLE